MSQVLQLDAVTMRFGSQLALSQLTLDCKSGTTTCLVGPNGAGKSTALALAAGLGWPTSGRLLLDGQELSPRHAPATTGYLPQRSAFHPALKVGEIVDFVGAARGLARDGVGETLALSGLDGDVLSRAVGDLSGGWLRRVGLVSALAGAPRLILLDEPFVGLDPETLDRLVTHLKRRRDEGAIVVVASHDFEVLDLLEPSVAVLDEGRLCLTSSFTAGSSSRAIYREGLAVTPRTESVVGRAPNEVPP